MPQDQLPTPLHAIASSLPAIPLFFPPRARLASLSSSHLRPITSLVPSSLPGLTPDKILRAGLTPDVRPK